MEGDFDQEELEQEEEEEEFTMEIEEEPVKEEIKKPLPPPSSIPPLPPEDPPLPSKRKCAELANTYEWKGQLTESGFIAAPVSCFKHVSTLLLLLLILIVFPTYTFLYL